MHLHEIRVLLVHVLDLDLVQGAELDHEMQQVAGVQRVDVHPHLVLVTHQDQGLTALLQLDPQLVRVQLVGFQNEIGAVAVSLFLAVVVDDRRRPARGEVAQDDLRLVGIQRVTLSPEVAQRTFQQGVVTLPPGIHHAGVTQHRQQVRGVGHRNSGALDDAAHQFHQVGGLRDRGAPGLGGLPSDGQDGALNGIGHPLTRGHRRLFQRHHEVWRQHLVLIGQALGQPAVDLGEDHAAVAAGADQSPLGHVLGDTGGRVVRGAVGFFQHTAHGEQHVGAGIAVRHGENIQGVDFRGALFQPGGGGRKHVTQIMPAELFFLHVKILSRKAYTKLHFLPIQGCLW